VSPPATPKDLDRAIRGAKAAGELALRGWEHDLEVRQKAPGQPVTLVDLAADRLLHDVLLSGGSDDGWLSEESADAADRLRRRRVWIVDPIDGTRSYVARRPEFTISIGLAVGDEVVLGIVFNPATEELFRAIRGEGAWVDDASGTRRLAVRSGEGRGLLLASRGEIRDREVEPFLAEWDVAPLGSTAYKLARVAAGEADGFVSRGPKSEWDIAAGVLLVTEAGGRVTDLDGRPPRFNQPLPEVGGIVAAGGVYDRLSVQTRGLAKLARLTDRAGDPLHPGLKGSDE
jgi:myo-inositol-1(or 4)-monophosphatase